MTGTDMATYTRERPGMSAFVLEDGIVYHTYSAYARGLDGLWFVIAVARPFTNRDGERDANFINVVAWHQLATVVGST